MKWTDEEIEIVRKEYPTTPTKVLAEKLGCTVGAVKCQAAKMKITKEGWVPSPNMGPKVVGSFDGWLKSTGSQGMIYQRGNVTKHVAF